MTPEANMDDAQKGLQKSYQVAFTSARASRVGALPKPSYSFAAKSALLPLDASQQERLMELVLVSPDARLVLVAWNNTIELHEAQGKRTYQGQGRNSRAMLLRDGDALIDGYDMNGSGRSWTGVAVNLVAQRLAGRFLLSISQMPYMARYGHDGTPAFPARVFVGVWQPDGWQKLPGWEKEVVGTGVGAIGDDLRVVIAMEDGRLLVLDGSTEKPTLETKLPFAPTDLSLFGPDYALLSKANKRTTLHFLDARGVEKWSGPIDFEITQPPVDGADGKVYLVGFGAAAFQNGKQLWSWPSKERMMLTCFEDGTCALAVGRELRILHKSGVAKQVLATPAGEPIMTPPALGSDGSIWVATTKNLYVAR